MSFREPNNDLATRFRSTRLLSPVAVLLQQVPLERHVRRPGLTLQEGGAALHPVLNRLQSVLIACTNSSSRILWRALSSMHTAGVSVVKYSSWLPMVEEYLHIYSYL